MERESNQIKKICNDLVMRHHERRERLQNPKSPR